MSLSDNLKPFQGFRGWKRTYGAGMAKSRWAGTPSYPKTTDLSGSIFFLARARRSLKNRHSIHYSSRGPEKYIYMYSIGARDIAMVIVKFRPRWPHTWRNALHSLSRKTVTSGRKGKCIAAVVDKHTVAKYGVVL